MAAEPTRPTGPGGIRRPEESTLTQNFRRIATRSVSRSEQCSSTTKWTKNGDLWIISDRRGLPAGGPRRQPRTVGEGDDGGRGRWSGKKRQSALKDARRRRRSSPISTRRSFGDYRLQCMPVAGMPPLANTEHNTRPIQTRINYMSTLPTRPLLQSHAIN